MIVDKKRVSIRYNLIKISITDLSSKIVFKMAASKLNIDSILIRSSMYNCFANKI